MSMDAYLRQMNSSTQRSRKWSPLSGARISDRTSMRDKAKNFTYAEDKERKRKQIEEYRKRAEKDLPLFDDEE
jgi:hypothetical protein